MILTYPQYVFFKPFLQEDAYDSLEKYVLSNEINWIWRDWSCHPAYDNGDQEYGTYAWYHFAYHKHYGQIEENVHDAWKPVVKAIQDKFNCDVLRINLNCYTNQNKKIIATPHYDVGSERGLLVPDQRASSIILNFTNCNGGTRIADVDVPSFRNSAVLFSNVYEHSGIVQTDTNRRICASICTYPRE
jgi:hypothetical protein